MEALNLLTAPPVELISHCQNLAPFLGDYQGEARLNQGALRLLYFENGYGIALEKRILEVGEGFPYPNFLPAEFFYGGPGVYLKKVRTGYQNLSTGEITQISDISFFKWYVEQKLRGILEVGGNLLKKTPEIPTNQDFIGISEVDFFPYRKVVTSKGYLCGSYATTVLLSYLQDHQHLTLPSNLRKIQEPNYEKLAKKLISYLQPIDLPTVPLQISLGLRRFFHAYRIPVEVLTQSLGARETGKLLLADKQPFLLGVLWLFGSKYGNHWVTAYGYCQVAGKVFYKVHDNWGDYRKIISATLGNGLVTVKKRTK